MSEQNESGAKNTGLLLFLAMAGSAVGAGLYTLSNRCSSSSCGKFFSSPKKCDFCGCKVCPSCGHEAELRDEFGETASYWLCNDGCEQKLRSEIQEAVKAQELAAKWEALGQRVDAGDVDHFPVTYAKHKQHPKQNIQIESGWFKHKPSALRALKIEALLRDPECKTVWLVDFDTDGIPNEINPNKTDSVFRYKGMI